jgi:hypothetical protein
MIKNILSLILLSLSLSTSAQTVKEASMYYTIQIGTFDNPKQADFEHIRSYSYVYERDGKVFIGGTTNSQEADALLQKVKAKGYPEAFVTERKVADAKKVHIIQIVTSTAGEPIDWKGLSALGSLYTMPSDKQVRIVQGVYEDINDARVKLNEIKAKGYIDAFVKTTREIFLNPVSEFDTKLGKPNKPVKIDAVVSKGATPPVATPQSANSSAPTNSKIKRNSAKKLQEALKEADAFKGKIDGQAGKLTLEAAEEVMSKNRRLSQYNQQAQKQTGFDGWNDARLLVTITKDLNLKNDPQETTGDLLKNLPEKPLSPEDAKSANTWNESLWRIMDTWSAKSQYNDQVENALKIAFFKTQLHLEDYFMSKGIKEADAGPLALSVLRILINEDLDGY